MNNKTTRIIGLLVVFMLAALPFAAAEETLEAVAEIEAETAVLDADAELDVSVEEAGTTPDSAMYGLETAWENLGIAFTFDKAKKAEKRLDQARERLAELKKMAEEGKLEAAEKARLRYEKHLKDSEEDIDAIESDGDSETAREALEKVARLRNKTDSHYERVLAVKERILANLQERNVTPEQYAKLEAVFEKIVNKSKEVDARLEAKRESVKIKYKVLSGKNDTEVDDEEEKLEAEFGLDDSRKERAKRQIEAAKERVANTRERLEKAKEAGLDAELILQMEADLASAEESIADAEAAVEAGDDEAAFDAALEIRSYGNEISEFARGLRISKLEGNFEAAKERLKLKIEERREEHKDLVEERLRIKTEFRNGSIRERIEVRAGNLEERIETRVEARERNRDGSGSDPAGRPPRNSGDGVLCTQDAKECSDGSFVGRTGPNCEFAPCPEDEVESQDDSVEVEIESDDDSLNVVVGSRGSDDDYSDDDSGRESE